MIALQVGLLVALSLFDFTMSAPLTLIPSISDAVRTQAFDLGASDLVNLWEHGLRMQNQFANRDASTTAAPVPAAPKTIIAPDSAYMINLVPQDVGHPLYHDGPSYRALRHEFILDYFISDLVEPSSITNQATTYTNYNGKSVVFKKNGTGKITVNDVEVSGQHKLSDGTQLYVLEGLLFNHQKMVQDAFEKLQKEEPSCVFGICK